MPRKARIDRRKANTARPTKIRPANCSFCGKIARKLRKNESVPDDSRIQCENEDCLKYYHLTCENLGDFEMDDIDHYYCVECLGKNPTLKIAFYPSGMEKCEKLLAIRGLPNSTTGKDLQDSRMVSSEISPVPPTLPIEPKKLARRELEEAFGTISDSSEDECRSEDANSNNTGDFSETPMTPVTPVTLVASVTLITPITQSHTTAAKNSEEDLEHLLRMIGPRKMPTKKFNVDSDNSTAQEEDQAGHCLTPDLMSQSVEPELMKIDREENERIKIDEAFLNQSSVVAEIKLILDRNPNVSVEDLIAWMRDPLVQKEAFAAFHYMTNLPDSN